MCSYHTFYPFKMNFLNRIICAKFINHTVLTAEEYCSSRSILEHDMTLFELLNPWIFDGKGKRKTNKSHYLGRFGINAPPTNTYQYPFNEPTKLKEKWIDKKMSISSSIYLSFGSGVEYKNLLRVKIGIPPNFLL